MRVLVQADPFDIGAELDRLRADQPQAGGLASFVGLVRDYPQGGLDALVLSHFPALAQPVLEDLARQAIARFDLVDVTVIHRYGRLEVSAPIVLVACLAGHRQAAFDGAMFLMDRLKTDAPFWKAEETAKGRRWIAQSAQDRQQRDKWK